jgi:queuosine precursor transporter
MVGPSLRDLVKNGLNMNKLIPPSLIPGIVAMAVIVVASNILVQHPMGAFLTYGALTYPLSFLVNDITNRLQGVSAARKVVLAGFVVGLICSLIGAQIQTDFGPLVTMRVALGSGTAFLVGQLLDVTIFDRLRRAEWWRAPLVSTLVGSSIDSVIFFTIAFAMSLSFLEPGNDVSWAAEPGALLGMGPVVPFWVSLAVADWCVKFAIAVFGLLPFRLVVARMATRVA